MSVAFLKLAGILGLQQVRAAFIVFISTVDCFAATSGFGSSDDCRARGPQDPDCAQHNMMMVGEQSVFASHLPMFESPHRFQVILEVNLTKDGGSRNGVYAEDRREHPDTRMYTLAPSEIFVLSRLFNSDDKARRTSFRGTVFRGHLERGGMPIDPLTEVDVNVQRVVYAEEIGPPNGPDRADELGYIVFGRGPEMFLAHRITQPPDFEQLLSVKISGHAFTEDELNRGVLITVPDRPNEPARRLRPGETVGAKGHVTGAPVFLPLQVEVVAEPYFEEGELAAKFTMKPTPLEIEAGFGP